MRIVRNYLARAIFEAVGFVLLAFLALFAFFDFINELGDIGKNGYLLEHAILFVIFGLPARAYELLPIAALIGTIYALAQLAQNSEFTILRVSGLSTRSAAVLVLIPGLVLVALTVLIGEVVTPRADALSQSMRVKVQGNALAQEFRSGMWVKDTVRDTEAGPGGQPSGALLTRFVNIGAVRPDTSLERVRIYEFDANLRLKRISFAEHGEFVPPSAWLLRDVVDTRFEHAPTGSLAPLSTKVEHESERLWRSDLNPDILGVLMVEPERMAAYNLGNYIRHLEENSQKSERYKIAFWKKVVYPFAVLVMMALALPFAYLQARAGGISLKIFAGIMIGIGFYLLNNLFSHLGLLNTWPPFMTAAMPSVVALAAALTALRWVERH